MKILNLRQGSPEWHTHRAAHWNASDAPAMLGESPYCTRTELLHRMATGIAPDVDPATQRRFDAGHQVEALLRRVAEQIIGEPLHPFVAVADFDERYSASFDGSTFLGNETNECKLLNERLRAAFADMETIAPEHRARSACRCLPIDYRIQCEQQVRVAEAERVLFMAGELRDDGTLGDVFSCWYYPDDALWARIKAGWPQLEADRAAYVPRESTPAAVAAPVEALPAVSVRMDGAIAVVSNLDVFGAALRAFVAKIPAKPTSDQEFADADAACKALKRAEEALDGAEQNALGQVQTVESLTRTIGDLRSVARTARLATEKLVKARKEQIRTEEVQRGRDALAKFIADLNSTIGKPYMPPVAADFAAAISGKKTLDSLRNAVDTELARAKIAANEIAGRIVINLRTLREQATDYAFLFADTAQLVLKDEDAVKAIVAARITEHRQAEERRQEAERARIRAEEQAKAERDARAKLEAERRAAAAAELAAAKATPEGSELSPAAQAMNEQEGAQRFAEHHRGLPPVSAPVASPAVSSQAANVVPMPTKAPAGPPTLKLGEIKRRIAPLSIDAAGLKALGFEPAGSERAAVLFHEADYLPMLRALITHLEDAADQRAAA